MSEGRTSLSFKQGATIAQVIVLLNPATGLPLNLTGATGRSQWRSSASAPAMIDFQSADGSMTFGGTLGTVQLNAPYTQSMGWTPGEYEWDVFVLVGGVDYCYLGGVGEVVVAITQPSWSTPATPLTVTPTSATVQQPPNTQNLTQTLTVANPGTVPVTVTFAAFPDGQGILPGAVCSPAFATLAANGGQQIVTVTYATGALTVTGTLVFSAQGPTGTAFGVLMVQV